MHSLKRCLAALSTVNQVGKLGVLAGGNDLQCLLPSLQASQRHDLVKDRMPEQVATKREVRVALTFSDYSLQFAEL